MKFKKKTDEIVKTLNKIKKFFDQNQKTFQRNFEKSDKILEEI